MRGIAARAAWTFSLGLGLVGAAQAAQSYSFVLASGPFLTFVWQGYVPANYNPPSEITLDTDGGSADLVNTTGDSFVFGIVTFAGGGFYNEVTAAVGSIPQANGQYAVSSFTARYFDGRSFQTAELGSGQLNIGDFNPPGPMDPVPEPATYALMAAGLGALLMRRRAASAAAHRSAGDA